MIYQPMAIKEISRGGVLVETGFPLQIDSLHEFRLTLGEQSIVVKGRVAHSRISDVEQDLKVSSYVDDGLVMGEFFAGNPGTAIYNQTFRPFTPPVPFLLMRSTVLSDWKFFLDDDDWLTRWAERFGASATLEVARELRRFPWRGAHE